MIIKPSVTSLFASVDSKLTAPLSVPPEAYVVSLSLTLLTPSTCLAMPSATDLAWLSDADPVSVTTPFVVVTLISEFFKAGSPTNPDFTFAVTAVSLRATLMLSLPFGDVGELLQALTVKPMLTAIAAVVSVLRMLVYRNVCVAMVILHWPEAGLLMKQE